MADRSDTLLGYLHPNELAASFHKSLLDLIGHDLSGPRRLHSWAMVKCGPLGVPGGRNDLAKQLLKSDCEWLFMLDADMGFEPHTLDGLLHFADPVERPIVGGLAFAQRESVTDGMNGFRCFPRPTLLDWIRHDDGHYRFTGRAHYPANTLVRAGATGGACLLVHRSVLEKVVDKFGQVWFDQQTDPDGSLIGEDVSFFMRTRELGIPLHVHTGIRTTHYKHLWLGEDDFWQSFIPPPATERVDVIVPVLHRPQNVRPFMESLRASTGLAAAWFVIEAGDDAEEEEIRANGGNVLCLSTAHTFAEKVNFGYASPDILKDPAPWVLLVGDDVRFRPAWLDHAQDVARRYNAQVVGTNDLANPRVVRGEHATHPMISRAYIDEHGASWDGPGVVCHEGYRHWYVDDEIVTVAKQRGVFQAALGSQVEHLHPIAAKAEMDDVYRAGEEHSEKDQRLFRVRAAKHLK